MFLSRSEFPLLQIASRTMASSLLKAFNLRVPIILAPLGGGPSTPELVAAVCNSGGLGTLAGAYLSPTQICDSVEKIRSLTDRDFVINLFTAMPAVHVTEEQKLHSLKATRCFREELGLEEPVISPPYHPDFDQQFEAVLRSRPRGFSFIFGSIGEPHFRACKEANIYLIGTATTSEEAKHLEELGVDAIIAQGCEAGAHRGMFSPLEADPLIDTMSLTTLFSSNLRVPVIAAGGIMDGIDIARALHSGAQAAMLGTAFLLCPEAGTSEPYRMALRQQRQKSSQRPIVSTRSFSGRIARGLENRFIKAMNEDHDAILPFPVQNAFTRDIRNRASSRNNLEYLSLWAGDHVSKIREMSATELMKHLSEELDHANSEEI